MIRGLDTFRKYFKDSEKDYVLIGGVACSLWFDDFGDSFRPTKDFDVVLIVEALDNNFFNRFKEFIDKGGYRHKEKSSGAQQHYRFDKPTVESFPYSIELFGYSKDNLFSNDRSFKIRQNDDSISLSALFLDPEYYGLLKEQSSSLDGLSLLSPQALLVFKAKAFLDLSKRQAIDKDVSKDNIRKHYKDVLSLARIISPNKIIPLGKKIYGDLMDFVKIAMKDKDAEPDTYEELALIKNVYKPV